MKLTAKNFVEVLVDLEPIWKNAEAEQEHGEAEQKEARHYAGRIPDISGLRCD